MSFVQRIRENLDDQAGRNFEALVHYLGVDENDKQLALVAAIAPLITDLDATAKAIQEATQTTQNLPKDMRDAVDQGIKKLNEEAEVTITGKVAQAMEIMRQEIQSMARDCAVSEFSAASMLRSQAIKDEVRALRAAAEQFVASGAQSAPAGEAGRATNRIPAWFKYGGSVAAGLILGDLLAHVMR
jgi:flagellar hook-associated protein FlgK